MYKIGKSSMKTIGSHGIFFRKQPKTKKVKILVSFTYDHNLGTLVARVAKLKTFNMTPRSQNRQNELNFIVLTFEKTFQNYV